METAVVTHITPAPHASAGDVCAVVLLILTVSVLVGVSQLTLTTPIVRLAATSPSSTLALMGAPLGVPTIAVRSTSPTAEDIRVTVAPIVTTHTFVRSGDRVRGKVLLTVGSASGVARIVGAPDGCGVAVRSAEVVELDCLAPFPGSTVTVSVRLADGRQFRRTVGTVAG
jgi:hypothetical protein